MSEKIREYKRLQTARARKKEGGGRKARIRSKRFCGRFLHMRGSIAIDGLAIVLVFVCCESLFVCDFSS